MTVQLYNAEQVELLRSIFPDKGRMAHFSRNVIAQGYDFTLNDPVNGSYFLDNDDSYPAGWTEVDAAQISRTNILPGGYWSLVGRSTETSWKYRKQTSFSPEADAINNEWVSFRWGPILWADQGFSSDVDYYFGMYADNAGSINEDIFIRTHLNWNSAGGTWRVRGERKDGTTQTNSTYVTLSTYPLVQPIFVRSVMQHKTSGTGETARAYLGSAFWGTSMSQLFSATMSVTWGDVWLQTHQTRGGGFDDFIYIGGVDRSSLP